MSEEVKSTEQKKLNKWQLGTIMLAAALIVGAFFVGKSFAPESVIEESGPVQVDESRQVVQSITSEKQVVLMSLGVQGLDVIEQEESQVWGIKIPGTDRATFLQYSFTAKLGLEGGDVTVEQAEDGTYIVTIPEFEFIGHTDAVFETAIERNGALSWTTPEIDTTEMINRILSVEQEEKYLTLHDAQLREQAKEFYLQIIKGIDPDAVVEFQYASDSSQ